jgi:hypothetical protein
MSSSASSSRIINSPIFARASVRSRSSGSARTFSPRAPVSRKIRFQLSSSWAGTWLSRDTASSASPRSSRSTSSVFRWTLHRSGSSGASFALGPASGLLVITAAFRLFAPIPDLLGHRHDSQTGVQRNRVRYMPNFDSAESRWFETSWQGPKLPEHLYHFTESTLRYALTRQGFEIALCRTDSVAEVTLSSLRRWTTQTGGMRGKVSGRLPRHMILACAMIADALGMGSMLRVVARPCAGGDCVKVSCRRHGPHKRSGLGIDLQGDK